MELNKRNKVRVYWNLHKKCWSVQDYKTNKVIDHVNHISLEQAKFIVRKGGQKRVRKEGKKNVHAFVVGYISNEQDNDNSSYYWKITYNPYKDDFFKMAGRKDRLNCFLSSKYMSKGYIDKIDYLTFLGSGEVRKDFVGNIYMESLHHENGIAPRVYI